MLAAALLLAACGQPGLSPTTDPGDGDLQADWQLVAGMVNGREVLILEDHRITLTIEGSRISGTAACNGYGGQLVVEGGRLEIRASARPSWRAWMRAPWTLSSCT